MNQSLTSYELGLERPNVSAALGLNFDSAISSSFLDLFHAAEAFRKDGASLVLQFIGIGRGTDAAAVAAKYSKAASGAAGAELLYLDATGHGIWAGPDMMRSLRDGLTPREAALPTQNELISWGAVGRLLALSGDETARLVNQVRIEYSCCVVNCGVVRGNSSVILLAPLCDATVLVTDASKTRATEVGLVRAAVERAGGCTLGAIHTRRPLRLPRWLPAYH